MHMQHRLRYCTTVISFSNMILAIIWICLLTFCQCKVITVNNQGSNSSECCINGQCLCSSFSNALKDLEENTTVNITSQLVTLDSNVIMELLNNVTICGNNATVMCNNKGSMTCNSCSNIVMEGITWDQCANSEASLGITMLYASNIQISLSTFQHSNACASATFIMKSGFFIMQKCQFLFNHVSNILGCPAYGGLMLFSTNTPFDITVYITETLFHHNGIFGLPDKIYYTLYILFEELSKTDLFINNSTISASSGLGGYIFLGNSSNTSIILNNSACYYKQQPRRL